MANKSFYQYKPCSYPVLRIGLFTAVLFFAAACSEFMATSDYEGGRLAFPGPDGQSGQGKVQVVRFMPWEIWPFNSDLQGGRLKSPFIVQGDKLLRAGQRTQALESYYQAQSGPLAPTESEALIMRIASTELALDQPNKSLATLSNYFRTSGRIVDDVDARFSLVFAYAYGRRGDNDQSIAWFARAGRVAMNQPELRSVAEQGVVSMLKAVPDEKMNQIGDQWAADTFIRSLVGQERSRRQSGGTIDVASQSAYWGTTTGALAIPATGPGTTIGVLLPFSGQFANLGKSSKNGIDLAVAGRNQKPETAGGFKVVYRDAGTSPDQAVSQARELLTHDGANMILGPLLSEHAFGVGELARQTRVPLLALAKNSNFATGENIFRLGATADSQVRSLLDTCQQRLHIKRYAIVYPDDAAGREMAEAFRAEAGGRGLQLVYETSYPKGNFDVFVPIADALGKTEAEAVFFPDSLTNASRFFGALAPAFRERIRPLGAAMWDNPTLLANSSTALEGAVYVSPFYTASARPAVSQFIQAYQSAYGQAPDFLAAQAFDALTILAEAVRRQQAEGILLPMALQQVDVYEGLTGTITVRSDGELQRRFSVVQMNGGKIQEVPEAQNPTFVVHGDAKLLAGGEPRAQSTDTPMYRSL
jgi:branched-chain amino acid transport system substrate-binding protein